MTVAHRKVALVTGAARRRGIGRGIAIVLAQRGFDVVVSDIEASADEGWETVQEVRRAGGRCEFIAADVTERDQVDELVNRVEVDFGALYAVASNAGIAGWSAFADIEEEHLSRIVAVNLTGTFKVVQASARKMLPRQAGRIVVTSSVHVQMPMASMAVYGATKQSIRALVAHLAVELSPQGILVNHIGPGWVKSFLNDGSPSLQTKEDEAATIDLIPAARPAEPEEMGQAAAYLVSDEADYVTGSFLRVDGGFVVGKY